MSQNLFYIDVETTGFSPKKHEIIELAFAIEIDRVIQCKMELFMRPEKWDTIDSKALRVNGWTVERLKKLPERRGAIWVALHSIVDWAQFFNRSYRGYYYVVEYGNRFDFKFLKSFWEKCHQGGIPARFERYFLNEPINVLQLARKKLDLQSYTLENVARRLGIAVSPRRIHTGGYDRDLLIEIYGRLM